MCPFTNTRQRTNRVSSNKLGEKGIQGFRLPSREHRCNTVPPFRKANNKQSETWLRAMLNKISTSCYERLLEQLAIGRFSNCSIDDRGKEREGIASSSRKWKGRGASQCALLRRVNLLAKLAQVSLRGKKYSWNKSGLERAVKIRREVREKEKDSSFFFLERRRRKTSWKWWYSK